MSFVLATEILGASKRSIGGTIFPLMFALGIMGYSLLAYFVRDWRLLSGVVTAPSLMAVYYYLYVMLIILFVMCECYHFNYKSLPLYPERVISVMPSVSLSICHTISEFPHDIIIYNGVYPAKE